MFWWIIATLASFFVKGVCGFANSMVFTTIMSFSQNIINISPIVLLTSYPSNIVLAWKNRKYIDWKLCLWLSLLIILGNIPGVLLLKNTDASLLKSFFGIVVIALAVEMFLRERRPAKEKENPIVLTIIGILAGLLSGLYSVGALVGAYLSRVTKDSQSFKANACMVYFISDNFRVVSLILLGIMTLDSALLSLMLLPFILIGLFAGMAASKRMSEKAVKNVVLLMLVISGLALIVGG